MPCSWAGVEEQRCRRTPQSSCKSTSHPHLPRKAIPSRFPESWLAGLGSLRGWPTSPGACLQPNVSQHLSGILTVPPAAELCEPIYKREKLRCREDTGPTGMTQLARGLKEADTEAHGESGLRNASCWGSPPGPQPVLAGGTSVSSNLTKASRVR